MGSIASSRSSSILMIASAVRGFLGLVGGKNIGCLEAQISCFDVERSVYSKCILRRWYFWIVDDS